MSYADQVKSSLLAEINSAAQSPQNCGLSPGDFSRERKFPLEKLLQFLISMGTSSLHQEVAKQFSFDVDAPSTSAVVQQRNKLKDTVLPEILKGFNVRYPCPPFRKHYQLVACDGSTFTFPRNPKETDSYIPPSGRSSDGLNQIHLVALYDIIGKRYLDAIPQTAQEKDEYRAFADLIARFQVGEHIPIFLADRGFASYNICAHAIQKNAFFLIRYEELRANRLLGKDLPKDSSFDITVERYLSRTRAKKFCKHPDKLDQYRYITKDVSFDFLPEDSKDDYPISLRVLRFPISEDTYEVIVTNLPRDSFPMDVIKDLYHLRWGIETSFRELKYNIGALSFHSRKTRLIQQELWARMILYNFCSIITASVTIDKKDCKRIYIVNFSMATSICRHFLRQKEGDPPIDIAGNIARHLSMVREERHFIRKKRFQLPASYNYRFG